MAIGSTDVEVPPLMSWMEIVPPGGRSRAYLARRVSMRSDGAAAARLDDRAGGRCDEVVGAGRFLLGFSLFVAMVFYLSFIYMYVQVQKEKLSNGKREGGGRRQKERKAIQPSKANGLKNKSS